MVDHVGPSPMEVPSPQSRSCRTSDDGSAVHFNAVGSKIAATAFLNAIAQASRKVDTAGADYFTRLHSERAKKRAINQLEAMGYQVTLTHAS